MEIARFRASALRLTAMLAAVLAGTLVVAASPAAAVSCPTVDFTTHLVSPPPAPGVDWSGCNLSEANSQRGQLGRRGTSRLPTRATQRWSPQTSAVRSLAVADLVNAVLAGATPWPVRT